MVIYSMGTCEQTAALRRVVAHRSDKKVARKAVSRKQTGFNKAMLGLSMQRLIAFRLAWSSFQLLVKLFRKPLAKFSMVQI